MIIANRNDRPLVFEGALVFRVVPGAGELPALTPVDAVIYTPNKAIDLVRFFVWGSAADPLVGAGGATTIALKVGNLIAGNVSIMFSNAIANYNGTGMGAGFDPSGVAGVRFDAPALSPHSTFQDSGANVGRTITGGCDAGTVTGTMRFRLSYYPVNQSSNMGP